jgi:hypothetical protein
LKIKFLRDRNAKVDFLGNHDIPRVKQELEHQRLKRPNTWFSCEVEYLCAMSKQIAKRYGVIAIRILSLEKNEINLV